MSTRDVPYQPSATALEAAAYCDRLDERIGRLQRIHDRAQVQSAVRCPADFSLLQPTSKPCDLPDR